MLDGWVEVNDDGDLNREVDRAGVTLVVSWLDGAWCWEAWSMRSNSRINFDDTPHGHPDYACKAAEQWLQDWYDESRYPVD